jgi:Xaa-Pro aminopeptidase
VSHPVDEARLQRVREAMERADLDVIVARAPDNVVYLSDYWTMKGGDFLVFPREGEATLVVLAPQLEEAERDAWAGSLRPYRIYEPSDPRPPPQRALSLCLDVLRERGLTRRIGLELSHGVQSADRMVGEPGVPTYDLFRAFAELGEIVDATPLLVELRATKTAHEIARIRLANELAGLACEHVRDTIRPGMKVSEVGARYEAFVHEVGIGFRGEVRMARAFVLALSGAQITQFTPTGNGVVSEDEPTLLEIWVCADGYWSDIGKNFCPGTLAPRYDRMLDCVLAMYEEGVDRLRDGVPLSEIDRLLRRRIGESGYPNQSPYPMIHGVGARAHEPPWAHENGHGEVREGMVLAIEPGIYLEGGGALRVEDNYLITSSGPEKLCPYPDDLRLASTGSPPAGPPAAPH